MSGVQISLPRPIRQYAIDVKSWRPRFSKEPIPPIGARDWLARGCSSAPADSSGARPRSVVTVAQLVEPWTVTPVVAGSNPVSHPISYFQFLIIYIPIVSDLHLVYLFIAYNRATNE